MKKPICGKVIDLKAVMAGRADAEDLQKAVAAREELAGFHPAHAIYLHAQNQVSVNHRTDVIFLAGLPDVPESRPHFGASSQ